MTHRLRSLEITFTMVVAIGVAVASPAHAVPKFMAASYPATLTAERVGEPHELIGTIGTTTCNKVTGHGVLSAASSALVIEPSYSECSTENGFVGVTVKVNGCKYQFRVEELHPGDKDASRGELDIVCPPASVVELVIGTACTVKVPSQEKIRSVFFNDITTANPEHILITMLAGAISYSQTGMFCSGSWTNGGIVGELTVKADDSNTNPVGLKFE